jgi:hypothetical protein
MEIAGFYKSTRSKITAFPYTSPSGRKGKRNRQRVDDGGSKQEEEEKR